MIGERTDRAEIETDGDRWAIGRLIPPEARGAKGEIKKNIEKVNRRKQERNAEKNGIKKGKYKEEKESIGKGKGRKEK